MTAGADSPGLDLGELLLSPEEAAQMDAPGTKDAAVLVPQYRGPLTAVFTERRADLRHHAGEISFPGGRQDEPDEELRATALREGEEEIERALRIGKGGLRGTIEEEEA